MMSKRGIGLVSFTLFALYITGCLLLTTIGVASYKNIRAQSSEASNVRETLGYVVNKLRAGDIEGAVSVETRFDAPALVIKYEGGDECETLIYHYEGALYEMFRFTDSYIEPGFGTKLCEADSFEVTLEDGIVYLSCGGNTCCYALACGGGDE